jgi:hypothetical protein
MRWTVFPLIAFLGLARLGAAPPAPPPPPVETGPRPGTVEYIGGDPVVCTIEFDFGGMILRAGQGAAAKVDFSSIYQVKFNSAGPDDCQPGVILIDGTRIAGTHEPAPDDSVKFRARGLVTPPIPTKAIAWIVYLPFPAAQAADTPAGETGALLPGGDFFSGSIRGIDTQEVRVMNSVLGPRKFDIKKREVAAIAQSPARPLAAQFEIRTRDGSVFGADSFVSDHSGLTIRGNPLYEGLHVPAPEITEIRSGINRCRPLVATQLQAEPAAGLHVTPDGPIASDLKTALTCPVPPGFTEFITRVAPGADAAPGQKFVFTLFVNGAQVARSTVMESNSPPQLIRIPLNAARVLSLRVDGTGTAGTGRWLQPMFVHR